MNQASKPLITETSGKTQTQTQTFGWHRRLSSRWISVHFFGLEPLVRGGRPSMQ